MKRYLVGGAVRNKLLGIPENDRDYLVVGTTCDEMLSLGFTPVGKNYQVFLHPETREEYTLSHDLKADLSRRDLTINAIAVDDDGIVYDFFDGLKDLESKTLRHIQEQNFFDDPVRIFRVARFKAQLSGFSIHHETLVLMKKVSLILPDTEIPGERIFLELKKALAVERPSLFFEALKETSALQVYFTELEHIHWDQSMSAVDETSQLTKDLRARYSALVYHLEDDSLVEGLSKRLQIPNDWLEAALVVTRFYPVALRAKEMNSSSLVKMFYEMDAFRRPYYVKFLSLVLREQFLLNCFDIIKEISSRDVKSGQNLTGERIGEAIREERVKKLQGFILASPHSHHNFKN